MSIFVVKEKLRGGGVPRRAIGGELRRLMAWNNIIQIENELFEMILMKSEGKLSAFLLCLHNLMESIYFTISPSLPPAH